MNPTEPIAVTTGYYGGQATVKALDESLVLPVGLALYTHPLRGTTNWATAVGRAIEAAHGLKGGQHG